MLSKGSFFLILFLISSFASKVLGLAQPTSSPGQTPRLLVKPIIPLERVVNPGEEKVLLSLVLVNQDQGTGHSIKLKSLAIGLGNVSVTDIFESYQIEIPTQGISINLSAAFSDKFEVNLPGGIIMSPGAKDSLVLSATTKDDVEGQSFVLTLEASDFVALDYYLGQTGDQVSIVSSDGSSLSYQSEPFSIPSHSFATSVQIFPNPFHPDAGPVTIAYTTSSPSEVSLDIFTLTGEKVRGLTNPPNQNSFSWDGKNAEGRKVLSGVYLGRMKEKTTGKETKLRIGIVR